jgi:hypothetical protein
MKKYQLNQQTPERHTAVISNVPGMFWKLAWDIDQFDDIQRNDPILGDPLAFAAINVCISASSLRGWAVAAVVAKQRLEGKKIEEKQVSDHIYQHVEQQRMCEAIANTAKHSRFREAEWQGGHVRIDYEEPTEDDPGGLILRHIHEDGAFTSIALNAFMCLERNWWGELQNLGFAFPHTDPEWRQRRIRELLKG